MSNGIHRIHGRTQYQRFLCRTIFHNNSGYGNSVFNTTYNFNCGGGMFGGGFMNGLWGGLGMGLGAGLMNLFGGLFGLGNMYGSPASFFGFGGGAGGGMFGLGNMYGTPSSFFGLNRANDVDGAGGNRRSKRRNVEKDDEPDDKKVKDKEKTECVDADHNTFSELDKKANAIIASKTPLKDVTPKMVKDLYNKVKEAKDKCTEPHKDDNVGDFERLLERLKGAFDTYGLELDKDGNVVEKAQSPLNDGALPGVVQEQSEEEKLKAQQAAEEAARKAAEEAKAAKFGTNRFNDDDEAIKAAIDKLKAASPSLKGYTNGEGADITENNLKCANDGHGTRDVNAKTVELSEDKTETKFPAYINIVDAQTKNTHRYKCVGKTANGYGIYRTPDSDTNHNFYLMAYDTKEQKFKLTQIGYKKGEYGAGVSDVQNNTPTEVVKDEEE